MIFFFFKTLFRSIICSSLQRVNILTLALQHSATQCGIRHTPAQVLVDFEEKGSDVNV